MIKKRHYTLKQRLIDFDRNAKDKECNELFIMACLCFSIGIILFFCESEYILLYPMYLIWVPCFILGLVFLIPWLIYG